MACATRHDVFLLQGQIRIWLRQTCGYVTYVLHTYSKSAIAVDVVVNVVCIRMSVGEVTVNDEILLSLSCPLLSPCHVLAH